MDKLRLPRMLLRIRKGIVEAKYTDMKDRWEEIGGVRPASMIYRYRGSMVAYVY